MSRLKGEEKKNRTHGRVESVIFPVKINLWMEKVHYLGPVRGTYMNNHGLLLGF
jgi:hypothetical protein